MCKWGWHVNSDVAKKTLNEVPKTYGTVVHALTGYFVQTRVECAYGVAKVHARLGRNLFFVWWFICYDVYVLMFGKHDQACSLLATRGRCLKEILSLRVFSLYFVLRKRTGAAVSSSADVNVAMLLAPRGRQRVRRGSPPSIMR